MTRAIRTVSLRSGLLLPLLAVTTTALVSIVWIAHRRLEADSVAPAEIHRYTLLLSAVLLASTGVVAAVAWWLIRRAVLVPLTMIHDTVVMGKIAAPSDPTLPDNEIGRLARTVVAALDDAKENRVQLATLDQRLEDSREEAKAVKQALEQQRFIVDQHAIVSISDAHGAITFANDNLCAISGYSREELIGQDHRILGSGHHPKEFFNRLYQTINQGKVWRGDFRNRAKDGSFYWVKTTIVPVVGPDGGPEQFVSIRNDITALKEAQIALMEEKTVSEKATTRLQDTVDAVMQMAEEANRASKAKSDFLAVMSHEIRTPLNGILGMGQLALSTDLDDEQREYLEMLNSSANTLLVIINDILDFSKIESGRFELNPVEFSLRDVVRRAIGLFKPKADTAGLALESVMNLGGLDRFVGDPVRLQQIIQNLVSNALKFTREGRVSVTVTGGDRLPSDPNVGVVRFTIQDTGIGIAQENMGRLFQPFVQVDSSSTRKYGGTGLGLAICRRLSELMDGRIWAESTPGQGSTFHFHVRLGVPEQPKDTSTATTIQSLDEVMDYEGAIKNTGGDPQMMRDLCRLFLDDSPTQLESLRCAVGTGDWSRASSLALNLESSLSLLGSRAAHNAALAVRRACAGQDPEAARLACMPLEDEVSRFNLVLQRFAEIPPRSDGALG